MKITLNPEIIINAMEKQKFTSASLRLRVKEILGRQHLNSRQSLHLILHKNNNPRFEHFIALILALNLHELPIKSFYNVDEN